MLVEKPVDNVEKCVSIIIFPFSPQGFPQAKSANMGCIRDIIIVTGTGYVAVFVWGVSRLFLGKKLTNPPKGVKSHPHW